MKYAWIDGQGQAYVLSEMCSVIDVSISGYRAWKRGGQPDRKRLTDSQMLALIRSLHAEFNGAYGSPRMVRELRARGFSAGCSSAISTTRFPNFWRRSRPAIRMH